MENKKQRIEIADIFRDYKNNLPTNQTLCAVQQKAFDDIVACRTSQLGGHTLHCNNCDNKAQSYNSCRNRNCPKCQYIKRMQWVDKLAANLPATKHFHIVFTIPCCLHSLFYINQKVAYGLLFKAAGNALIQCAKNTEYIGAQAGAVALLHTWGQTLTYHPHIHTIVPSGGLSDDGMEWIPSAKKFFVPVKVLSAVFRGILCRLLEEAIHKGELKLPEDTANFQQLKTKCYAKKWVVYAQKPFSSPDNLIKYLGNYTHRVAISNHRIVDCKDGKVSFSYKDYKAAGTRKIMTLEVGEFIRRFMQHVLPSGFCKIRYIGFMALCNIKTKLSLCHSLILKPTYLSKLEGLQALEVLQILCGKDPISCTKCNKGKLTATANPLNLGVDSG